MSFIMFVGRKYESSRRRHCEVGISLTLIHELALILDVSERLAAAKALAFTYSDFTTENWLVEGEEIRWTLEREPYKLWYDEPIYALTVETRMPPLKLELFDESP